MEFPNIDSKTIAFDTETTGLRFPVDKAFGISVAAPGASWYYDLRETPEAAKWMIDLAAKVDTIVCHNASFDYKMAMAAGIKLPLHKLDDTVIRACNIYEHLHSYSLDALAERYLGRNKVGEIYEDLAKMFGGLPTRNVQMPRIANAPSSMVSEYAKVDAELTLALWEWQNEEIARQEMDGVPSLREIADFERSVMPSLIGMECHGVRVDEQIAEDAMGRLTPMIDVAMADLTKLAGKPVNINSSPQVRALLKPTKIDGAWTVDGKVIGKTKSGAPSLDAKALRIIDNQATRLISDIRSMIKTRDTFLSGHILGHCVGGRVYPSINQSKGEGGGTGTGRLSYSNPALQQIPTRNKKVAAIVKRAFLPDDGQKWLDLDEASFEVRVFAHLANDRAVIETFRLNPRADFHAVVASMTNLPRNASYAGEPNAKQLDLGMIFNQGNGAIAQTMGMAWDWDTFINDKGEEIRYRKAGPDAMDVINRYHSELPGVKRLAKRCRAVAETRGFVFTKQGRRLRFPNGYKSYKASGLLIQATAADKNKENIAWADEIARTFGGRLLLNTHDSYSISAPEESLPALMAELREKLDAPGRLRVPLILDESGYGDNWFDATQGANKTCSM